MKNLLYPNFAIFPCHKNKAPACESFLKVTLENPYPFNKIEKSEYIGLRTGIDNLEVIDVDNHFGNATEMFAFINDNYDLDGFPIIKTGGGGYHIYFRSNSMRSGIKYAMREFIANDESKHIIDKNGNHEFSTFGKYKVKVIRNKDGDWVGRSTLVESKAHHGYVICPPSPGYVLAQGDFLNIPLLTEEQRAVLISICVSLNEVSTVSAAENKINETADRPGDVYNKDLSNIQKTIDILKAYGWKSQRSDTLWTRPGKELKDGVSATFGKVGENKFYVFSSNAHPFTDRESYSMFSVKAMLENNGDYKSAAKEVAIPNGQFKQQQPKPTTTTTVQKLEDSTVVHDEEYIRIGDNYYKNIHTYDKNGYCSRKIVTRSRQTLIDDFGKHILSSIKKYDDFCNVPSHNNYQKQVGNCFNMYNELPTYEGDTEKWETIELFLKHIFGNETVTHGGKEYSEYEMGIDYIQILWNDPTHILPILCLVSEENQTGKSTFGNFLHIIFGGNYANIGSGELTTEFNSSYASKLIAMIDEGYIPYKIIGKLKHVSTAPTIMLRQMRRDHTPIDFFCKFIICSNQVKDFIVASENDERYWVRKIPKFGKFDPNFLKRLKEEVPAFLRFMATRELHTQDEHRQHFNPKLLRTKAFEDVIRNSKDLATKDFIETVLEVMESNKANKLDCIPKDLKETFFMSRNDITISKIREILQEQMKLRPQKFPMNYEFLAQVQTKRGRFYTIDIEIVKDLANVFYNTETEQELQTENEQLPF